MWGCPVLLPVLLGGRMPTAEPGSLSVVTPDINFHPFQYFTSVIRERVERSLRHGCNWALTVPASCRPRPGELLGAARAEAFAAMVHKPNLAPPRLPKGLRCLWP